MHSRSLLGNFPVIGDIESTFDSERTFDWMNDNLHISFAASAIYVTLVFAGKKWMTNRHPYDLCNILCCWNVGLAIFSLFGMMSVVPNLYRAIVTNGYEETVCKCKEMKTDPHVALWSFLYALSKIVEFGDTTFVILRKSHLQFLHWYHHITVLIYSWYGLTIGAYSIGLFFGAMNYSVHVVMYSYFALKAFGIRVPSLVASLITVLQISQMFFGLYINYTLYKLFRSGRHDCWFNWNLLYYGIVVYGSYAVLFLYFFYRRYVVRQSKNK